MALVTPGPDELELLSSRARALGSDAPKAPTPARTPGEERVRSQRGFGYLEVLLALVVVASAVSAAGLALQSHALGQRDVAERSLARSLVAEGLELAHALPLLDPETGAQGGLEAGELAGSVDDVGDLDGRSEAPPRDALGQIVEAPGAWRREFAVERVAASAPEQLDARGGLLRLRVGVWRDDVLLAESTAWRVGER